ncbi:glycosyltransferase family 2 protein [Flavobacterium sp. KACC 22763]|uniref:glycosyltransferase family 2 protein n=1 Tax=Flavobacterium sp. KACC 22763 TaxID=3025668 RepID=UPI0023663A2B|nr:glycosyltransferase family 2 protein [Flavobacterium sp. KACC 22763]WDF62503.1 glycosyltransferase family 2 protein [Flavobacterium sp. KACC 22763]
MIYIIIPVLNRWNFTKACLESLCFQTYSKYKIVVVDHGSTDETSSEIRNIFPEVIILQGNENMWWTAATNLGVKYALYNQAEYVLTLNNDLIVDQNYLETIISTAADKYKSIIGSVSVDRRDINKIVFAGIKWNSVTAKYRSAVSLEQEYETLRINNSIIESDLLPGRGTLYPIEVFKSLGVFDEIYFPHYSADEDFSLRCKRNGYSLFVSTSSVVFSEVNATGLKNLHRKKTIKYWRDTLTSKKSPVNIKRRWYWAKKNSCCSIVYFLFDYCRILGSEFKKNI